MNDEPEKAEETPHDYETEAATFGWKSADDFGGDNGNHMSAEAFMLKGPGTSRKAEARIAELEKGQATFEAEMKAGYDARMERMERAQEANAQANIEARAQEISSAKRQAAESGDMEAYDALEKDTPKPAKAPASDIPEADRRIIEGWLVDNDWFKTDPIANDDAIKYYNAFTAGGASTQDALDKVTERMKLKSPYLFPVAVPKKEVAAVDGGGLGRRSSGKKAWSDVPADDKRAVENQIKNGDWDSLAAELKVSPKEAFATKYWSQE